MASNMASEHKKRRLDSVLTQLTPDVSNAIDKSEQLLAKHEYECVTAMISAHFRLQWRKVNLLALEAVLVGSIDAVRAADTAARYLYEDFLHCTDYHPHDNNHKTAYQDRLRVMKILNDALDKLKQPLLRNRDLSAYVW